MNEKKFTAARGQRKQAMAEGSETAADIDKKIEFHKQGQAAAQYKGSMNKMHAAKIRELQAKKEALKKQGVAEGPLKKGQYEMMMRNGQVKKFVAKDDAEAKRIAKGNGAKSVIRLKGGVPAGKVSEQGVAEADKHSMLGKIQRGHELKKKVDSTWKDIGNAQKAGDKEAGSKAFRKHERYANLERPGTWTKVDEQGVTEEAGTTWEVNFEYGPHMAEIAKVEAGSEEEAIAKVREIEERRGRRIMINWAKPAEKGMSEAEKNPHTSALGKA